MGALAKAEQFCLEFPHELANVRRQIVRAQGLRNPIGGLQPVTVNGSRAQGLSKGFFQTRLRDGTAGYLQRRTDDCLQAAIASCLQIPPYMVPDLQIDQQRLAGKEPEEIDTAFWGEMCRWMDKSGVTIMLHPIIPTSERRWIGVVKDSYDSTTDHCLLMSGRECLFDAGNLVPPGRDEPTSTYGYEDIDYGITIERR